KETVSRNTDKVIGGDGGGPNRPRSLPQRAGRDEGPVPGHPVLGPDREGQARRTMRWKPALNAFATTLRRPLAGSRNLLMKTSGNTVRMKAGSWGGLTLGNTDT